MRYVQRLADAAGRHADDEFLIEAHGTRTLTHGEAQARAAALAGALRDRGLRRGDRLAVGMPNGIELALVYVAALQAGLTVVPLGASLGGRQLRPILAMAEPRLLLAAGPSAERLVPAAEEAGVPVALVASAGAPGDLDPWADPAPAAGPWQPFDAVSSADVTAIHFTSGTTGEPRGVAHTLRDFVANAERYAEACRLDGSHRFLGVLPMTYMAGYHNLLLVPWVLGASVVVDRAFDATSLLRFWDAPVRHGVDVLWLVPTILAMLLELDRGEDGVRHCRERVRHVACATAPLDPDLRRRFEERYGVTVHDGYGLSETLVATSSTPRRPAAPGTVGAPLPGVEVEVRLRDGGAAGPGEEGAVHLRTPDATAGYLEAGGEHRGPAADGWLDTGDLGSLTADGELRITGRSKEVIIRGGVNVSAAEVERALRAHRDVADAAVVGVPHPLLGEEIAAVLVCRDGLPMETVEASVKAGLAADLEAPQRPGLYVQIDSLPVTPTGKVRKAALRELVIEHFDLPRGTGFALPEAAAPEPRIVDLSHPIREGMTTFPSPNHPRTEITVLARHHIEGRATRRLVLGTHTGTHVDAALHFVPGGAAVDELPLDVLVGPARVVDLRPVEPLEEIGVERLRERIGAATPPPRLLLRYGWSDRFGDGSGGFYEGSPYLARDACAWLVEHGVRLIGMDTPSPDDPRLGQGSDDDSPNHKLLLGAGVVLLEYLNGLDRLEAGAEVMLAALPLRVEGADGAPARVVAIEGRR